MDHVWALLLNQLCYLTNIILRCFSLAVHVYMTSNASAIGRTMNLSQSDLWRPDKMETSPTRAVTWYERVYFDVTGHDPT
jgi:hypothetical protein